jgi:flagellar basal body-associated protein FliL
MQQNTVIGETQNIPPKKKKKRGCCFGCLMIILALIILLLGSVGYLWYKSIPKKTEAEKQYNSIPDYFEN